METHEVLNEVTSGLGPELTRWTARVAAGCWVFWLLMVVAGVSGRSRRVVWTVGIPVHWGFVGLTQGSMANLLTPYVGDANTRCPEFKSFLVNVEQA